MDGTPVTYRQQKSFCSKSGCRKCREGIGHGPYWYAYKAINGRTVRTYIGKTLPADVQREQIAASPGFTHSLPAETSAPLLRLTTLGHIRLEVRSVGTRWQTVTETGWRLPQARLLLACLARTPQRQATPQEICGWLWPDLDTKSATQNLRRASTALEQTLGPGHFQQTPTLFTLAEQIRLWIDCTAFEETLDQAYTLPARQKTARSELLLEAIHFYGGVFLPEEQTNPWITAQRNNLHSQWLGAIFNLVDLYLELQNPAAAIDLLEQLLATDPAHEAAAQRLMLVLARQQRRVEAMQVYQRLLTTLHTTAQATPRPETQALSQAIQQGHEILFKPLPLTAALRELTETRAEIGRPTEKAESTSIEARQPSLDEGETNERAPLAEPAEEAERMTSEISIGRNNQSPLIGRDREQATLYKLLEQVESAQKVNGNTQKAQKPLAHCQVLMGETGIGKTRLAEESAREAQRRGWTVIWSRAYAQEQGNPYYLWTNILRNVLTNTPELIQQAPEWASATTYAPLLVLVPNIQEKLGIKPAQEPLAYKVLSSPQEELRLRDAVYAFLLALSSNAPLLLILDDIQWTDESGAQMLGYLTRRITEYPTNPIVLLATCREAELSANRALQDLIAQMKREGAVGVLHVQPLSDEHIGTLVSYLPDSVITHIQHQAAGNPLFAEELGLSSLRTNVTPPIATQPDTQEETQALPSAIAAALTQRLNLLSKACQDLLDKAAVLGRSFDIPLISAIVTGRTTDDDEAIIEQLDEARLSDALAEEGSATNITYRFRHPLLANHLLNKMTATKRKRLHRHIAEILRQIYADQEGKEAATITGHLILGGAEPALIAQYAEMAAQHAYNLFAYPEAGRYYRIALKQLAPTLLTAQAHTPLETPLLPGATLEKRLYLSLRLERLAECARILGNFQEAPTFFLHALQLRAWPARTFATPAEEHLEAQIQAMLWAEIAWIWRYTGDAPAARLAGLRGEEVLRTAGIVDGAAWASLYHQRASLYWHEGYHQEALQAAQQALELFNRIKHTEQLLLIPANEQTRIRRSLLGDPINTGRAHNLLGIMYMLTGQLSESLKHLQQALAINDQYDRHRESANVYCNTGHIHLLRAEYAQAKQFFQKALDYAELSGDDPVKSVALYNMGELATEARRYDEAEDLYLKSLKLAEEMNDREYLSTWNAFLSRTYQEHGKFQEAADAVLRALKIGRAMSNQPCIGTALIALANLRIALVEHHHIASSTRGQRALQHAETDLRRALNLRGLDAETRTRAKIARAQISHLRGALALARQQAQEVCTEAQQYELKALQERCQRLLDSISESEDR